jgi:5-methyltetrahydropteroyltriglutamate--homocysteine methyltransferase
VSAAADAPLGGVLVTTVVGSYPQPDWLIDRERLQKRPPPRARARELWRIPEPFLEQAQDDATVLAIREMERAGIDVITDGEIRRESYSNRFANSLAGIDLDNPGTFVERSGVENSVPRIVGPIRRVRPVEVRDVEFLRANTDRPIKITIPGPFTMAQQTQDEHYHDERAMALDFAAAVNEEVKGLFARGADVVQMDEPYMQARPEKARLYAVEAINAALDGVEGETALHMCFGYGHFIKDKPSGYSFLEELNDCTVDQLSIEAAQPGLDASVLEAIREKTIVLGVVNNADLAVETPELVAARIRLALGRVLPERLIPAPDCGMKYLPREVAFAKLRALVEGAGIVRAELSGRG